MSPPLPIRRVVLYTHGAGHFERRGKVTGRETLLELPGQGGKG